MLGSAGEDNDRRIAERLLGHLGAEDVLIEAV